MKKLNKRISSVQETVEGYVCSCPSCPSYCGCSCYTLPSSSVQVNNDDGAQASVTKPTYHK